MDRFSVCVIYSDQKWCRSLCRVLEESLVFDVYPPFHDGGRVIEFLYQKKPQIIVLDILLPQVDGMYIITYIANRMPDYNPLLYVLSSLGDERTNALLRDLPIWYYSLRPISADVVANNVYNFLFKNETRSDWWKLERLEALPPAPAGEEDFFRAGVLDLDSRNTRKIIDNLIDENLRSLGAPAQLLSTKVTHETIKLHVLSNCGYRNNTELYKSVCAGNSYISSYKCVERNIRTTIRYANQYHTELYNTIFDDLSLNKMTNNYFIAKLSKYILNMLSVKLCASGALPDADNPSPLCVPDREEAPDFP